MHQSTRTGLLTVAALAAFSGCQSAEPLGPDAPQGIEGLVLLGPQCPVQSEEDPCPDLPYAASIDVRRGGDLVARLRSDDLGRFRVGLEPGDYRLVPEPGDPFPTAGEQDVTVRAGKYTAVTVSYDTGIR